MIATSVKRQQSQQTLTRLSSAAKPFHATGNYHDPKGESFASIFQGLG